MKITIVMRNEEVSRDQNQESTLMVPRASLKRESIHMTTRVTIRVVRKGNTDMVTTSMGTKVRNLRKLGRQDSPAQIMDRTSYARHEYNAHQDEKLVETKCSTVEDRVPCNFPFADEKGLLFVCRTFQGSLRMFSREESICIPANEIAESDVCGCCEGSCPETCMCTCDMKNGSVGVKVERRDALLSYQECVPPDIALRMVDRLGDVACIADCTDTLVEEASI